MKRVYIDAQLQVEWLLHLRTRANENPRYKTCRGKLKPNTINNYWRAVRLFYKWAYRKGKIAQDPTAGIEGPKATRPYVATFKEDHVAALLQLCPPNTRWGARDRAIIITLLRTGVRLSELCSMEVSELNLDQRCAKVRGKAKRGQGQGPRERVVYLDGEVRKTILDWLMLRTTNGTDTLWTTHTGKPLTPNAVELVMRRIKEKVGADDVRISAHTFRHTFAVNLLRHGKDIRFVQACLGHDDIESTQIYVRTLTQEDALEWRKNVDPFKGWKL